MSRPAFFPKAESIRAWVRDDRTQLPSRPTEISPILDSLSSTEPLLDYDLQLFRRSFRGAHSDSDGAVIPPRPADSDENAYLVPMLTSNERLRLTMLWYYTKGITEDQELLHRIQEKVDLVNDFFGWEFALCGLMDNDVYERLATSNLPLAILPRRECTCAHTLQQNPGVRSIQSRY